MNPNIPNEEIEEEEGDRKDTMDYENEVSPTMIVDEEATHNSEEKSYSHILLKYNSHTGDLLLAMAM